MTARITTLAQLVSAGCKFIEEALHDNPDGPVEMITTIGRVEIDYAVIVGGSDAGDHGRARIVWHRTVVFGATDATCAGGRDFVIAAREQERIAWGLLGILEERQLVTTGELPERKAPTIAETITTQPRRRRSK